MLGVVVGGTGAQMGASFRKQLHGVDDLEGLKVRIGSFAGQMLTSSAWCPQQIAGGEIYPALEKSWSALPPLYRRAIEAACAELTLWMIGKYDQV